jgi:hypothetical protein
MRFKPREVLRIKGRKDMIVVAPGSHSSCPISKEGQERRRTLPAVRAR